MATTSAGTLPYSANCERQNSCDLSCSVQLSYHGRQLQTGFWNSWAKTRFRMFSVTRLWIILDGARNLPIFSHYLRQHYRLHYSKAQKKRTYRHPH